jgi:hypothetical protein
MGLRRLKKAERHIIVRLILQKQKSAMDSGRNICRRAIRSSSPTTNRFSAAR